MDGFLGLLAEMWVVPLGLGMILMVIARPLSGFLSLFHERGVCLGLRIAGFALIIIGIMGWIDRMTLAAY